MGIKIAHLLGNTDGGNDQANLLHGSDVPKGTAKFKITIVDVREAPQGFNAALILDIKPVYNCGAFAVNKTNLNSLASLLGTDTDKWKKKTIELFITSTNNPKTGKSTRGLRVAG